MKQKSFETSYLYALAAIVLWSTLAVLSVQLAAVPPFLLVGITLTLGGLCGVVKWRDWKLPPTTVLLGIYGLFGYHFCLFMAFRLAPAVEANLINYLWPLLMVVLTPVILRGYRLTSRHLLAGVCGFTGAVLIVTQGRIHFASEYSAGYLFAGACAFIWASFSLFCRRVKPFPTGAVGLFCFLSGLLSLACHWFLEPKYVPNFTQGAILILVGLGPLGAAFYLWDAALKKGDPRVIGSLAYLTPLLSTLWLVLGTGGKLSPSALTAMVLIIGGALLGSSSSRSTLRALIFVLILASPRVEAMCSVTVADEDLNELMVRVRDEDDEEGKVNDDEPYRSRGLAVWENPSLPHDKSDLLPSKTCSG